MPNLAKSRAIEIFSDFSSNKKPVRPAFQKFKIHQVYGRGREGKGTQRTPA